jgi:hypothetical protein
MEAVTVDTPGRDFPQGAIRVSDAERDAAVAELSQHYQQGRLTVEEFDERSGRAFAAKTGDDLHALFVDLPSVATSPLPSQHDLPAVPGANAASADWGSALGSIIPTIILVLIALALIRRR